jgi:hypothetical protein
MFTKLTLIVRRKKVQLFVWPQTATYISLRGRVITACIIHGVNSKITSLRLTLILG